MSDALAKSSYLPPPDRNEWGTMIEMANTLAKAQGFLPAHFFGQPYKILAAVLFGRDLGISATNALQHIIVIDGKATADAQLIGMLVRRAGHSIEDQTTDEISTVTITRGDDKTKHEVTFSMQDAQRAGLLRGGSAWQKYPQAMLYARALTACARKGAQDALMGTIYTPEEIGAEISANGDVVLPPSGPTGEIPTVEASPATQAALSEWQERHERQQTETDQVMAEPSPTITGNSESDEILPPGQIGVPATTGSVEPQPAAKRRGRPLGSKNAAKGGTAVEPRSPAAASEAGTRPQPPTGFGEEEVSVEEGWLRELRSDIRKLASRLRKYQYMEQNRELPPLDLWNKEVERTLGIYIERKFGTEVVLEDIEEAGLQEALNELKGYIAKYESPELPPEETGDSVVAEPDTAVVSLHKPIVRNPVAAQRRDPTAIDPKVALDRARALAELHNRTTALLAIREGKVNLSAQDEERLRGQADATMEKVAQNAFSKAIKDLDVEQLHLLNERAKAAAK